MRAVVHNDQLQVRVGLGQDGGNRFAEPVGTVKSRDNDAD